MAGIGLHAFIDESGQRARTASSSVVVLKPFLPDVAMNDDTAYLYTLRFLMERLSWFARRSGYVLGYTLAHVVRFKLSTLRAYDERLRQDPQCRIAWDSLDPRGGSLDQPKRNEMLQLGDLVASATAAAFNPDAFGNTEQRYLVELSPRLYRHGGRPVTSYGLKMHPWSDEVRAAHPWVAAL